jgi:hypothetical protein
MNVCLFADSFLPKIGGMELAIHYLADCFVSKGVPGDRHREVLQGGVLPFAASIHVAAQYGNRIPFSGRTGLDALAGMTSLLWAHSRRSLRGGEQPRQFLLCGFTCVFG